MYQSSEYHLENLCSIYPTHIQSDIRNSKSNVASDIVSTGKANSTASPVLCRINY
jgi:hypothetical protein